uniref:NDUFB9 n=1 Tax=Euglena gracilis TaxID=3039 RepID=UPI002FE4FACE|eukprot:EG_transcript_33390
MKRSLLKLKDLKKVKVTQPQSSIVLKPVPIGEPIIWSRVQHLYWRALHVIEDFPWMGPSQTSEQFDIMLSVKEEIQKNANAAGALKDRLLEDFEAHIKRRDWMQRRVHYFANGGPGYQTFASERHTLEQQGVWKAGTPIPFPKSDYNDDGPVEKGPYY